ncbi:hypothetical protein Ancab_034350 [Ancistrocladus abbreviatus]
MLKRYLPFEDKHLANSNSETESDDLSDITSCNRCNKNGVRGKEDNGGVKLQEEAPEELVYRAKIYQQHMKRILLPKPSGFAAKYNTWVELAMSIEEFYKQPLHYLTFVLLKQWDELRDGKEPLHKISNVIEAEATVWLIEDVHRLTTTPEYLARLWLSDPQHHDFY